MPPPPSKPAARPPAPAPFPEPFMMTQQDLYAGMDPFAMHPGFASQPASQQHDASIANAQKAACVGASMPSTAACDDHGASLSGSQGSQSSAYESQEQPVPDPPEVVQPASTSSPCAAPQRMYLRPSSREGLKPEAGAEAPEIDKPVPGSQGIADAQGLSLGPELSPAPMTAKTNEATGCIEPRLNNQGFTGFLRQCLTCSTQDVIKCVAESQDAGMANAGPADGKHGGDAAYSSQAQCLEESPGIHAAENMAEISSQQKADSVEPASAADLMENLALPESTESLSNALPVIGGPQANGHPHPDQAAPVTNQLSDPQERPTGSAAHEDSSGQQDDPDLFKHPRRKAGGLESPMESDPSISPELPASPIERPSQMAGQARRASAKPAATGWLLAAARATGQMPPPPRPFHQQSSRQQSSQLPADPISQPNGKSCPPCPDQSISPVAGERGPSPAHQPPGTELHDRLEAWPNDEASEPEMPWDIPLAGDHAGNAAPASSIAAQNGPMQSKTASHDQGKVLATLQPWQGCNAEPGISEAPAASGPQVSYQVAAHLNGADGDESRAPQPPGVPPFCSILETPRLAQPTGATCGSFCTVMMSICERCWRVCMCCPVQGLPS